MTEAIEQWIHSLEQQIEEAKNCPDMHKAEEKAQDVLKKSSQMSKLLISIVPEEVRQHWIAELERMEENEAENRICCSFCGKIVPRGEGIVCPLRCRDQFCNKTCLRRGFQEHRKRCLMDKKRKLRRALEQNGMEW